MRIDRRAFFLKLEPSVVVIAEFLSNLMNPANAISFLTLFFLPHYSLSLVVSLLNVSFLLHSCFILALHSLNLTSPATHTNRRWLSGRMDKRSLTNHRAQRKRFGSILVSFRPMNFRFFFDWNLETGAGLFSFCLANLPPLFWQQLFFFFIREQKICFVSI